MSHQSQPHYSTEQDRPKPRCRPRSIETGEAFRTIDPMYRIGKRTVSRVFPTPRSARLRPSVTAQMIRRSCLTHHRRSIPRHRLSLGIDRDSLSGPLYRGSMLYRTVSSPHFRCVASLQSRAVIENAVYSSYGYRSDRVRQHAPTRCSDRMFVLSPMMPRRMSGAAYVRFWVLLEGRIQGDKIAVCLIAEQGGP